MYWKGEESDESGQLKPQHFCVLFRKIL